MSHLHIYVLTLAENEEDAISNARICIEDEVGEKQWFDYGDVDIGNGRKVLLLSEVRAELVEAMEYPEAELKKALDNFDKYRANGETGAMGYQAWRIHEICSQIFCEIMPFWNMEIGDWTMPEDNPDDGTNWYAVPVDLHY
jgi:hypothetical protein